MAEVNEKFAASVTNLAFNLSLSKNMVVALLQIAEGDLRRNWLRRLGMYDTTVPTNRRLEERGLVYAKDPQFPGLMSLTEAGKHVVALLELAGLAEEVIVKEDAA